MRFRTITYADWLAWRCDANDDPKHEQDVAA